MTVKMSASGLGLQLDESGAVGRFRSDVDLGHFLARVSALVLGLVHVEMVDLIRGEGRESCAVYCLAVDPHRMIVSSAPGGEFGGTGLVTRGIVVQVE